MKNKQLEFQSNNVDKLNSTDNRKIWISPQMDPWLTDQIEAGAGTFVDGGLKSYGPG